MIFKLREILEKELIGKTFINSDWTDFDEEKGYYDALGNFVSIQEFDPRNKVITEVDFGIDADRDPIFILRFGDKFSDLSYSFYESQPIEVV